ncbi:MAG: DUF4249 domain-containing protein [Sediminibacterium sp.]|nr:DUF4249 domain-containing protein [Sediminibacterium sp.]
MRIIHIICIVAAIGLLACRKDVQVKLPTHKQKIVVEASIEVGGPAVVFLSYTVPYFGNFDFSQPQKAFIKGALVIVSDGNSSDTLKELDPQNGYLYLGTKLFGQTGKTYYLTVKVNDKIIKGSTFIREPVKLDSLYFKGEQDTLGFIWQRFSEPAGSGNYYRWFAKRKTKDQFFAAPFGSTFEDRFIDGKSFDFSYDRGPQPNQVQEYRDDPERGFYKRGDTVIVKFCHIGQAEYQFWNTYYQNKASNGNPFSAPTNVKSNYNDPEEVFGCFVGYAPFYDTIIIPKKK